MYCLYLYTHHIILHLFTSIVDKARLHTTQTYDSQSKKKRSTHASKRHTVKGKKRRKKNQLLDTIDSDSSTKPSPVHLSSDSMPILDAFFLSMASRCLATRSVWVVK